MKKSIPENDFHCFPAESLELANLHSLLLSAVAPRPIAFASTRDKEGNINLSPFSFFNVFGANPPLMIFSPARRVRDNTTKHTLQNVKEHPEVVINVVSYDMVEQMSLSSTEYDKGINEFLKSGFTPLEGEYVSIPRVAEAPVAFECAVEQVIETGDQGGAGNLVICRVLNVIVREKYLDEEGKLDLNKLDLVGRMGGSYYVRASGNALFEIPKPIASKGMGVDKLPESAKSSNVLTGNNLGRLGNVEEQPTKEEVEEVLIELKAQGFFTAGNLVSIDELHRMSVKSLEEKEEKRALCLLWIAENLRIT